MKRMRRGLAVASVAVVAAVALSGCGFVNDVFEGQRITTERLGVDGALRALVAELQGIDGVVSAAYHFDAVDVGTRPGLEVELETTEFPLWDDVLTRIHEAGRGEAFAELGIASVLTAGAIRVDDDARYDIAWLTQAVLDTAADATSLFPRASVSLSGVVEGGTMITLSVHDPAEQVLTRLTDDPAVVDMFASAQESRQSFSLYAEGLDVSGTPGPEVVQWTRDRLAADLPRSYDEKAAHPELLVLSIAGYDGDDSISGSWAGASAPGERGPAWDAFLDAVRAGRPTTASGACVLTSLSFSWPGIGQSATVVAPCDGPVVAPAPEERPAVTELREALETEGLDLDALGFIVG
jgi:hypothetical protein